MKLWRLEWKKMRDVMIGIGSMNGKKGQLNKSKRNHITVFIIAYGIVVLLLWLEYILYMRDIENNILHFNIPVIRKLSGVYITNSSGIWLLALLFLMLIPLAVLLFGSERKHKMLLFLALCMIHTMGSLIVLIYINDHEQIGPVGIFQLYENCNRYSDPQEKYILCTQDSMPAFGIGGKTEHCIYLQTKPNTLKQIRNVQSDGGEVEYIVEWDEEGVRFLVCPSENQSSNLEEMEWIRIEYDELDRLMGE